MGAPEKDEVIEGEPGDNKKTAVAEEEAEGPQDPTKAPFKLRPSDTVGRNPTAPHVMVDARIGEWCKRNS